VSAAARASGERQGRYSPARVTRPSSSPGSAVGAQQQQQQPQQQRRHTTERRSSSTRGARSAIPQPRTATVAAATPRSEEGDEQDTLNGEDEVLGEAPSGLGPEAALRYQKAQLRAMAEQLREGQVTRPTVLCI
jgi:hypothetical protein